MVLPTTSDQQAHQLATTMGVTAERCGPRNALTLRKTCVGSTRAPGVLQVHLRYSY